MKWEDVDLPRGQKRSITLIEDTVLFATLFCGLIIGVLGPAHFDIRRRLRKHRLAAVCCSDLIYLLPFTIGLSLFSASVFSDVLPLYLSAFESTSAWSAR